MRISASFGTDISNDVLHPEPYPVIAEIFDGTLVCVLNPSVELELSLEY